jgi:hypothetical protein
MKQRHLIHYLFSMMLETEEQTWLGQGRENLGLAML